MSKFIVFFMLCALISGCAANPSTIRTNDRPTMTAISVYHEGDVVRFALEGLTFYVSEVHELPDHRKVITFEPIF